MATVKGKIVFLSGPMSGLEHYNVGEFAKAHAIVKELGAYKVYDPAIEYLKSPLRAGDRGHEFWMRECIHELTTPKSDGRNIFREADPRPHYDVVVMLPGWEGSEGARTERMVAEACGIEVCELSEVE